MGIIGDNAGGIAVAFENLRADRIMMRQISPIKKWKRVAASEDLDTVDNRGKRAQPVIGKIRAFLRELIQIRRLDRLLPQKSQMVVPERVATDDQNIHNEIRVSAVRPGITS